MDVFAATACVSILYSKLNIKKIIKPPLPPPAAVSTVSATVSAGLAICVEEATPFLIVSGFGPFNGIKYNPTTKLIGLLREFGSSLSSLSPSSLMKRELLCASYYPVEMFCVVDTSIEGVERFHDMCKGLQNNRSNSLLVHLGVSGASSSIHLEQFAYNNATFRVPDEAGAMPSGEKINKERAFDEPAPTPIDLAKVCVVLNHAFPSSVEGGIDKPKVALSQDPGRFFFNYINYRSLQHFKNVVFIHVPPFEVICEQEQLAIVRRAVIELSLACRS